MFKFSKETRISLNSCFQLLAKSRLMVFICRLRCKISQAFGCRLALEAISNCLPAFTYRRWELFANFSKGDHRFVAVADSIAFLLCLQNPVISPV